MEWVIQTEGADIRKVLLDDSLGGIEFDKRVVNRHCEVAGCFIFFTVYCELCGENFVEL